MDYYTFTSSMVPIGDLIKLVVGPLWATLLFVVAYYLGRGFRALWGRR